MLCYHFLSCTFGFIEQSSYIHRISCNLLCFRTFMNTWDIKSDETIPFFQYENIVNNLLMTRFIKRLSFHVSNDLLNVSFKRVCLQFKMKIQR